MISDLDLWRAADILAKRYGADAPIIAAQRADDMLAHGDIDGQAMWKSIVSAINDLQRTQPNVDERRH